MSKRAAVLVTGAGRGIGQEITRLFLQRGFTVVALDRDFSAVNFTETAALRLVTYDLTNVSGIASLVETFGAVGVLVNNAGILNGHSWNEYEAAARDRMLAVNLMAPVELIRAIAPQMIERRCGRIINIASIGAFTPHPDVWYGVTKAGVVSFTKSFASYLGRHGIQVNAVAPGPIETEMFSALGVHAPERMAWLKRMSFSGRFGQPAEIAEVVLWLATNSPAYVNGTVVDVMDGCLTR